MPSTYKTDYLSLNYWAGEDKPKRDDFNYDNRALDTAYQQLNSAQSGQASLLAEYERQLRAVSEQVTGTLAGQVTALENSVKAVDGRVDAVNGRVDTVDTQSQGTATGLQQHLSSAGHVTDAERQKWNAAEGGGAPVTVAYSGNGAVTQSVAAGFRPSCGFVYCVGEPMFVFVPGTGIWQNYSASFSGDGSSDGIEAGANGITVTQDSSWGDDGYQVCLNQQGKRYVAVLWK